MILRTRNTSILRRPKSQINITPLIDVLLVLLVIFMVIVPNDTTGLQAEIPQQPTNPVKQESNSATLILNMDRQGALSLNHEPINSVAELPGRLENILKTRSDRTIFVQGDDTLEFEFVARVIDAARSGGAERIGLLTSAVR